MFFAVYALGFGNHLSMILLAPAFTLFLLMAAPGGWRSMVTPRVSALAAVLRLRRRARSTPGTCGRCGCCPRAAPDGAG